MSYLQQRQADQQDPLVQVDQEDPSHNNTDTKTGSAPTRTVTLDGLVSCKLPAASLTYMLSFSSLAALLAVLSNLTLHPQQRIKY